MKKLFFVAIAALLTTATFAQSAPAPTSVPVDKMTKQKHANAPQTDVAPKATQSARPMADANTRAQKMTERLTKQLSLDAGTSSKVLVASLTRCKKVDEIMKMTDNKAKNIAFKTNADDYKSALKGILTPAQFSQMEEMKSKEKKGGKEATKEKEN